MTEGHFVPAAGRDWLLPLYDPLTTLLGVRRFHRHLLEQADIAAGSRVLDVGCGTGNLSLLAKRLHPAAEVAGIDPDPKALARAHRKAQRSGVVVRFDLAYAEHLPFPDASFDRVLSALMLHHLDADAKVPALREVRRVLRPGGSLHLADFDAGGHARGLHGFLASILHARHARVVRSPVPDLMRDAGLAHAEEVARRISVMGPIVCYRAVRSPSPAPAAASRSGTR
jgi:ubiquinone/menaquinone biosynthesis C-methylase UbiE